MHCISYPVADIPFIRLVLYLVFFALSSKYYKKYKRRALFEKKLNFFCIFPFHIIVKIEAFCYNKICNSAHAKSSPKIQTKREDTYGKNLHRENQRRLQA